MDAGYDGYGAVADLYDHVVPYRQRADVGFFVEAATASGGPVLELGCGTGRILIPCVYQVTHPDGRLERVVHAFPMRYIFRYEMEHLLARAGFLVEHLYSDFEKHPYGHACPGELIFVARKA